MDKYSLQQQVLNRLAEDLLQAEQAVRAAHETATHEENIAEKKTITPLSRPGWGSMKLVSGTQLVQVISSETPLGRAMLGKCEGDEVSIQVAQIRQQFQVLRVH